MTKLFIPSSLQNNRGGYLMLELIISLFINITLAIMLFQCFAIVLPRLEQVKNLLELYDASHYTFSILEKNIGYDAAFVTIEQDIQKKPRLNCQTLQGNLSYSFTKEGNYLYKTINKASTSGKNPLYISGCQIDSWKLIKLGDKALLIEIKFRKQTTQIAVKKIIYCLNGRIMANE